MTCKHHSKVIDLSRPRLCLAVPRSSAGTFGLQKLHSIVEVSVGDQSSKIRWRLLVRFLYHSGCARQVLSCETGRGRYCCKLSAGCRFLAPWSQGEGLQLTELHRMVWCNWLLTFERRFWPDCCFRIGRVARAWWPHLFSRHERPVGCRGVRSHG